MDLNSLLTLGGLILANAALVLAGIVRQENRMTKVETLIDGLKTKLSEEISEIRAHFRAEIAEQKALIRELEARIRELEGRR